MGTAREILQDEDLIEEDDEASVDVMDATRELVRLRLHGIDATELQD
ncbi:hypothetical protein PI124_g9538 [Phytophthora idaei]|nr:hypothetical protein PI124_g9538 [Phytophthora idaei]